EPGSSRAAPEREGEHGVEGEAEDRRGGEGEREVRAEKEREQEQEEPGRGPVPSETGEDRHRSALPWCRLLESPRDDALRVDAFDLGLGAEDEAMREHGLRQGADVVREHELTPL